MEKILLSKETQTEVTKTIATKRKNRTHSPRIYRTEAPPGKKSNTKGNQTPRTLIPVANLRSPTR